MRRIQINWADVFGGRSSSPESAEAFIPASAPAPRPAAAAEARRRLRAAPEAVAPIQMNWADVFGRCSSSPDRADAFLPASAPARRRATAAGGRRRLRAEPEAAAPRPSVAAPAKGDEREGEGSTTPAAKKSRQLDVEKEDALLHMLGEINKSLQASLKSPEPLQVPKDASPEEIFEVLKGIPRLARADRLRAYSLLTQDDRRFRSLMALPKSMRKEWLLMEIRSI